MEVQERGRKGEKRGSRGKGRIGGGGVGGGREEEIWGREEGFEVELKCGGTEGGG